MDCVPAETVFVATGTEDAEEEAVVGTACLGVVATGAEDEEEEVVVGAVVGAACLGIVAGVDAADFVVVEVVELTDCIEGF